MIFVVDTNTFSEPMKPEPDKKMLSLLTSRQFDWGTSATAWEEFTLGIRVLPASARRNELEAYRRGPLVRLKGSTGIWTSVTLVIHLDLT